MLTVGHEVFGGGHGSSFAPRTDDRTRIRQAIGAAGIFFLAACRPAAAPPPDAAPDPAQASYDRFRQPERVIEAFGLAPGQRVADVGAGDGYLTFRIAAAVGATGRVVATEIDDGALATLRARAAGHPQVEVRKVAADDPGLEPAGFDLVVLSAVDHYLADREDYLRRLRPALASGGRLAVVNRRAFRDRLLAAARRAGFQVHSEFKGLPLDYLVLLEPAPL